MRSCIVRNALFSLSPYEMLGRVWVGLDKILTRSRKSKLICSDMVSNGFPYWTGKNSTVLETLKLLRSYPSWYQRLQLGYAGLA